jgi:predicted RNase H-like nuclease
VTDPHDLTHDPQQQPGSAASEGGAVPANPVADATAPAAPDPSEAPDATSTAPAAADEGARRVRPPRPPRFLGLDMAWAPRNSSGGAVMELTAEGDVKLTSATSMRAHEDILGWVARNRGRAGCVLAVNAPMIVENTSGRRPCDALLEKHFAAVDAYQVNTVNASQPRMMGRALMRMGFDPHPGADGDRLIETYNQPTQVLLFDAERPIRLKIGPVGSRKEAVDRFRELLYEKLGDATPRLVDSPALDALVDADLPSSNGSRVGELEERLEAVLCAYTAAYLYVRGPSACAMLGDLNEGYLLIPMSRQAEAE